MGNEKSEQNRETQICSSIYMKHLFFEFLHLFEKRICILVYGIDL